ncbi:hypothetical protein WJX72_009205 [[Myrmecia] bisecta]|uniref:Symplekin n=1 Tax=[Myrmecia] bisecta TaxID=41462 RepID=A0AAW1R8Q8_9CHLO
MEQTRDQAVQLLNDAKLASDANAKVDKLTGLIELVVRKQPALLQEFLPELVLLQAEPQKPVRLFLAQLLEEATAAAPEPHILVTSLRCLTALLGDAVPAVVKRSVLAANPVFRVVLAVAAGGGLHEAGAAALREMWAVASEFKSAIIKLAVNHSNDGVKLNAIKFLEQTVVLYTGDLLPTLYPGAPSEALRMQPWPPSHALLKPTVLAREAEAHLMELVAMLKPPKVDSLAGPITIVAIKVVSSIAQQRPNFMGRVLPTLLGLASRCGEEGSTVAVSTSTAVKAALLTVLRCRAPTALPWHKKVTKGLQVMGAGDAAEAENRKVKEEPQAAPAQGQPGGPPAQQQVPAAAPPQPAITPKAELDQIMAVLGALAADPHPQQRGMLNSFVAGLQPALLADVVIANMARLPTRGQMGLAPAPAPNGALLAGLMQGLSNRPATPPGPIAGPRPPQGPPPVPIPVPVARPPPNIQLAPKDLTHAQRAALRRGAVERILAATKTPARHFRAGLLARLATKAPKQDGVADEMLESLLRDFHAQGGYALVMKWLFSLYVADAGLEPADALVANTATGMEVDQADGSAVESKPALLEGLEGEEASIATTESRIALSHEAGPSGQEQRSGPDLSGSQYEAVLLAVCEGVREALPAGDRTIARILLEAPVLPSPGVPNLLRDLCAGGGDWATLGLTTAQNIIMLRPPNRFAALGVVLDVAVCKQSDARGKAIRLVANKLFPMIALAPRIERFASQQLHSLMERPKPKPTAAGKPALPAGGKRLHAANVQLKQPLTAANADEPGASISEADGNRLCGLYCVLCTKRQTLLRGLFEVYAAAGPGGKAAIQKQAPALARVVGPAAPALIALVNATPPRSEPLMLACLYALTEKDKPPEALVKACLAQHTRRRDPRWLVPALAGMTRAAVVAVFPSLLNLDAARFNDMIHRLRNVPEEGKGLMNPSEILVALHTADLQKEKIPIRKLILALNLCLDQRDVFTPEALALTLQQLVVRTPLPPLFMRFVIQTQALAPKLKGYIMELLGTLVSRNIWSEPQQWKGWVMCAKETAPDSFPALLQLPTAMLKEALRQMPPAITKQLLEFATSGSSPVTVPRTTLVLLKELTTAVPRLPQPAEAQPAASGSAS